MGLAASASVMRHLWRFCFLRSLPAGTFPRVWPILRVPPGHTYTGAKYERQESPRVCLSRTLSVAATRMFVLPTSRLEAVDPFNSLLPKTEKPVDLLRQA